MFIYFVILNSPKLLPTSAKNKAKIKFLKFYPKINE